MLPNEEAININSDIEDQFSENSLNQNKKGDKE